MTLFSFSSGNPSNLVGGGTANMTDISGSLTDVKTFLNGAVIDSTNIAIGGVTTATIAGGAVTTSTIAANAVTAAKIEQQPVWAGIAMTGFVGQLGYFRDSLGMVHFRGDANTSTSTLAPGTLCTLPAGFRPGTTQTFHIFLADASTGQIPVTITTAGVMSTVVTLFTSPRPYTFGHVHYRAEN